ncbi:N-acetylmuramidase family protein [Psychrobacter pygoscelis]|uniref:N-acetylmuramidase family protein n=1 Tax=Psychrobacter pygoscelis TaxID=2488563 RepID=UPI00103DF872|nr:N-acetylmuramidase family protein [Psychrobacter pygoscelis]
MDKKLTERQIKQAAQENGIEYAALRSAIEVECKGSGFDSNDNPVILFEPHILWRELGKVRYFTKREQLHDLFPDICCETWDRSLYNVRPQHQKLYVASVLHWNAAHSSCSWGIGQVMGFNWQSLGYKSLREFIDAMHESEAKQLDAMIRFIKVNGLLDELQRKDWAGFAKKYNGSSYKVNKYDEKLAAAYKKFKRT